LQQFGVRGAFTAGILSVLQLGDIDGVLLTIKRVDIRQCISLSLMLLDDLLCTSYKEQYVILEITWGFAEGMHHQSLLPQ
jgi:hypothetical protein